MQAPAISTEQLTKRYSQNTALDAVSIEVPHGSIGLLGENGAGKSTFIKLALGLLKPTSGTASVLGFSVLRDGLELRRRVGYMPEDDCLPTDMTAFDLVIRMGRLSGLPKEAAMQRAFDVFNLVGLGEARYRNIGGFSVGMKQRVKLAQALVHDPKLVLMDEPTSGLDPEGREEMLELIKDIRSKMDISLLLSTHLLHDVEQVCDQVIIIRAGQVVSHGAIDDVISEDQRTAVKLVVQVRVVGDRERFIKKLKADSDVVVEEFETEILVEGEPDEIHQHILKAAVESDVQLRRMVKKGRSLEEHFIALHNEQPTDS